VGSIDAVAGVKSSSPLNNTSPFGHWCLE